MPSCLVFRTTLSANMCGGRWWKNSPVVWARWLLWVVCLSLTCLVTPASSALPTAPNRLFASEVTASSVKLSWDAGRGHADPGQTYVVQYRVIGSGSGGGSHGEWREKGNIQLTVHTVTQLKAFTQYEFRVLAVNSIGRGKPSDPIQLTTGELGG